MLTFWFSTRCPVPQQFCCYNGLLKIWTQCLDGGPGRGAADGMSRQDGTCRDNLDATRRDQDPGVYLRTGAICYRCGMYCYKSHRYFCRARRASCHYCKKLGHYAWVCLSKFPKSKSLSPRNVYDCKAHPEIKCWYFLRIAFFPLWWCHFDWLLWCL